jgi:hypothetical protein
VAREHSLPVCPSVIYLLLCWPLLEVWAEFARLMLTMHTLTPLRQDHRSGRTRWWLSTRGITTQATTRIPRTKGSEYAWCCLGWWNEWARSRRSGWPGSILSPFAPEWSNQMVAEYQRYHYSGDNKNPQNLQNEAILKLVRPLRWSCLKGVRVCMVLPRLVE